MQSSDLFPLRVAGVITCQCTSTHLKHQRVIIFNVTPAVQNHWKNKSQLCITELSNTDTQSGVHLKENHHH